MGNRGGYPWVVVKGYVTGADPDQSLTSEAYHITVDGGRDSFYALSIELEDSETAWLMSDTVRSLSEMR